MVSCYSSAPGRITASRSRRLTLRVERDTGTAERWENFGRCTPGGNTHKFKTQWDTTDQPLWWYERRAAGAATPSEGHGAAARGPKLWKRLPLSVANVVGPRVIRFIP